MSPERKLRECVERRRDVPAGLAAGGGGPEGGPPRLAVLRLSPVTSKRFPQLGNGQQRGSRPRCHLLTDGDAETVAARLTELSGSHVRVTAADRWLPDGFAEIAEARSPQVADLAGVDRSELVDWWLANPANRQTLNWDIAAAGTFGDRKGVVLVEAKAHAAELKQGEASGAKDEANRESIARAIGEANAGLSAADGRAWNLSRDRRYQLSNRFAFAWKLASLGVPVALIYLGFVGAGEMDGAFDSAAAWECAVRHHAAGIIPDAAWGETIDVAGTPLAVRIHAAEVALG